MVGYDRLLRRPGKVRPVERGLYESVVTTEIEQRLDTLLDLEVDLGRVDPADQTHVLARHLARLLERRLGSERDPERKLQLANQLLAMIDAADPPVAEPMRQLRRSGSHPVPGHASGSVLGRRSTPALLPIARQPPLATGSGPCPPRPPVDRVRVRAVARAPSPRDPLVQAAQRASLSLTTTYIGGTVREALDRLVRASAPRCKVQYDAARTRLHAKAWLFRRNTGFDTAYVGSSNLSTSALLDGVEWNVRLSTHATPSLFSRSRRRSTPPGTPRPSRRRPRRDRNRLDDALIAARGGQPATGYDLRRRSEVALQPQQDVLDASGSSGAHPRHAPAGRCPGTGKRSRPCTRRLGHRERRTRLLFVAHRREILEQSLACLP